MKEYQRDKWGKIPFLDKEVVRENFMQIEMLKSKIHRATVTDANLNYIGSISIDKTLIKAAN